MTDHRELVEGEGEQATTDRLDAVLNAHYRQLRDAEARARAQGRTSVADAILANARSMSRREASQDRGRAPATPPKSKPTTPTPPAGPLSE